MKKDYKAKLIAIAKYYNADAPISKVIGSAMEDLNADGFKVDKGDLIKFLYIHEAEIIETKKSLNKEA